MTEVFDSSDPKAVQGAIKAAKSADDIALEGLKQTLSTPQGRKWLYRTLMLADPFKNPWSPDAATTSFQCGEINITMQLLAEIQTVSLELYLQMIKENKT